MANSKCEWTEWKRKTPTFESHRADGALFYCGTRAYIQGIKFNHERGANATDEESVAVYCCSINNPK